MNLRTIFESEKSKFEIEYNDSLFFLGSCFSDNISSKLQELKFKTLANPFGIVYNPISIFKQIDFILEKKKFGKEDLIENNQTWSSFDFHSDVSAKSTTLF